MNDDGLVVENRDTGRDDVDEEWLEDENIEVGDGDDEDNEEEGRENVDTPAAEPTVAEPETEPATTTEPESAIERDRTPLDATNPPNQGAPFADGA